jgi:hypothetical protein
VVVAVALLLRLPEPLWQDHLEKLLSRLGLMSLAVCQKAFVSVITKSLLLHHLVRGLHFKLDESRSDEQVLWLLKSGQRCGHGLVR